MKLKIIHFQIITYDESEDIVVLLDNGRVFRKTSNGGPYYWVEVTWLEDMIKYFGEEKIKC